MLLFGILRQRVIAAYHPIKIVQRKRIVVSLRPGRRTPRNFRRRRHSLTSARARLVHLR